MLSGIILAGMLFGLQPAQPQSARPIIPPSLQLQQATELLETILANQLHGEGYKSTTDKYIEKLYRDLNRDLDRDLDGDDDGDNDD